MLYIVRIYRYEKRWLLCNCIENIGLSLYAIKNGENTNPDFIKNDGFLFKINERYWNYIIVHLLKGGYIEGVNVTKAFGNEVIISDIENCQITPKGIDYLCNNSLFEKAKCFLKEIKDITPFV